MTAKQRLKQQMGANQVEQKITLKEIEEIEEIIDEALKEVEEEDTIKQMFEAEIKEEKKQMNSYKRLENIEDAVHCLKREQLKHRTEDYNANVKFGKELVAIHKFQGKWMLIVLIIISLFSVVFGMTIQFHMDTVLPYLGLGFDTIRTAISITK